MIERLFSEAGRRSIYGVSMSILTLLAIYGVISRDTIDVWAELIGGLVCLIAISHVGADGLDEPEDSE